jgi:hypothetical protein
MRDPLVARGDHGPVNVEMGGAVAPDPFPACAGLDEACAAGLWEAAAWLAGAAAALIPDPAFLPDALAEPFPDPALILGWPVLETVVTG